MKGSTVVRRLAPLQLVALAACLCLCASAAWSTTYYVDSAGGNDNWNGTSPGTAWQNLTKVNTVTFSPGDEILLKAGSVWNGQQLYPKGSGSAANPIVVDTYDTGAKPLINGAGAHQEAVHLYNQEYWEISNLEVTNYDPAGPGVRQGVHVLAEDVGTVNHIYLLNLDVHDVNGHMTTGGDKGKCNGGILVDVVGAVTPTNYNDVLIDGCYVYDVSRTAIKINSAWGSWCTNPTVLLHTNVVVSNNVVDNYAGDGICPFFSDGALAEYNVSSRGCYELEGNLANAPIWSWDQKDGVFQYNEVYDTVQTRDGMAFDIDGCSERNTFQYNYSHDNAGGFLMIISGPDCAADGAPYVRLPFCKDNIVRYNISQRDETRVLRYVGKISNNTLYNNTIYIGSTKPKIVDSGACDVQSPVDTFHYNNIIYNTESRKAGYTFDGTNYVWDYNLFYGYHPNSEPDDAHKLTSDPLLVNPGSGGTGMDTVDGYKLQSGSPARDSGMTIADNGGLDYWGNTVPTGSGTDRGAHEYDAGPQAPVAEFSGNPTSGAPTLTVNFTDLSMNSPTSWDWTFGDGGTSTAQSPSHDYTSDGDYTVALTATNGQGQDTETKIDYISVSSAGDPPVADFSGIPTSGSPPLTVNFTDLSTNSPTSWDWTFGDGGTDTVQDPSHQYTSDGDYTVSLTAANSYGQDTETKVDYISVATAGDYSCASATIVKGTLLSGDHTNTHASDDSYMVVHTGRDAGKQTTVIEYSFETGLSSVSGLTITSESHPTLPGQRQRIHAYNFTTSQWSGAIGDNMLNSTTDQTTMTVVPDPSLYLSGTGEVRVKIVTGHKIRDAWDHYIDLIRISATP